MNKETVRQFICSCLLISFLFAGLLFNNVNPVKGLTTVYIWSDGLVEPSTAPIQRNGNTYIFTDSLTATLIVQKSNIVLDGNNHLLQSDEEAKALYFKGLSNVTIKNLSISKSRYAIYLENSSFNIIENNDVSNCGDGIVLDPNCNRNVISGNKLSFINYNSVFLGSSSYNTIFQNQVVDCNNFIEGYDANNNIVFDNDWAGASGSNNEVSLREQSNNNMIYHNTGNGAVLLAGNNNNIFGNSVDHIVLFEPYNGLVDIIPYTNCTVHSNRVGSITLSMTSYSSVFNNTILGHHGKGIYLQHASSFNEINDNNIKAGNIFLDGAYFSVGGSLDCTNNTISGNTIVTGDSQNGIKIMDGKGSRVLANSIQANGSAGIWVNSGWDSQFDVKVSGNIVTNSLYGVYMGSRGQYGNVFSGNLLTANKYGVFVQGSVGNMISGNNVSGNVYGIYTEHALWITDPQTFLPASNNTITGNVINGNTGYGIYFNASSKENTVYANDIKNNNVGVGIGEDSSLNLIYHNNFVNNEIQVSSFPWRELWNSTYPTGGNFWSNFSGEDVMSGPYQTAKGRDGISDTPHVLDSNNKDHYPLTSPVTISQLDVPSALPEPSQVTLTSPEPEEGEPFPAMWVVAIALIVVVFGVGLGLLIYLIKR